MNKMDVLKELNGFLQENGERYGILSLGVFGSVARETFSEESDVDVVIQLEEPNLLTLSRVRIELEARLKRPVDVVSYRERMNPFLKRRIEQEACYV